MGKHVQHRMNKNSLANLTKPKTDKRMTEHGYQYTISRETVDDLFDKMIEGATLTDAAKQVGVAYETAKKYFDQGDSNRGIQPLKIRLTIFQEKITIKHDEKLLKRREEMISMTGDVLKKLQGKIKDGSLMDNATLNQFERIIRLEIYLRGGATGVGIKEATRELTAEEIRVLAGGEGEIGEGNS